MTRLATAATVVCMILIAAALGAALYVAAALDPMRALAVALAAFAAMALQQVIAGRLRRADADRAEGEQLAGLSHGVGELARQVSDFSRRLQAIEHRVVAADVKREQRSEALLGEIGELGALVRQLAVTVADHEDVLSGFGAAPAAVNDDGLAAGFGTAVALPADDGLAIAAAPSAARTGPAAPAAALADTAVRAALAGAADDGRIDIHLQPLVSLPQRKVRFYEAMARLRGADGTVFTAERVIPVAEAMGLASVVDLAVARRAIQVLRRLIASGQDSGLFCNVAAATLADPAAFAAYRELLETHRALASALVLEFRHDALTALGPVERKHLGTLAGYGYRFSVDHVGDLRIKARDLAERGVRFAKVPAALLLDDARGTAADIHPADLADLLSRFGIDLIAERIEDERTVADLLDYEVRLAQGNLFAPPRPLRPEQTAAATAPTPRKPPAAEPTRGTAALLRRAAGAGTPRQR